MKKGILILILLTIITCGFAQDNMQLGFHNQQNNWSPKMSLTIEPANNMSLWLRKGIGCTDPAVLGGVWIFNKKLKGIFYLGASAKENLLISSIRLEAMFNLTGYKFAPALWLGYGVNEIGKNDFGFLTTGLYQPQNKNSFGYRLDSVFYSDGQMQFLRVGILWKYNLTPAMSLTSWLGGEKKSKTAVLRIMAGYNFK